MALPTIIVQGIIAFIAISAILSIPKSIIQIESGKVGIVYRAGKLQETLLNPGFGVKIPYVDSVEQISLSFLTERVKDIPCGTNGGVTIYFELIEVVHRLKRPKVIETVANYSISYAQKSVKTFNFESEIPCKGQSKTKKSNLIMSVFKIQTNIISNIKRTTEQASVFVTGILEYLLLELITNCIENCSENMISKNLLEVTVNNDSEFRDVFLF